MTELQFPFDLINRTRQNLKDYSGPFETTHLINSALGLIVLPYERIIKNGNKDRNCAKTQNISTNTWWDTKVNQIGELSFLQNKVGYYDYHQALSITVKKLRHGLAHQNIEFVNRNKEIEKIIIWNCPLGNKPKDLEIEFGTEELKTLVLYIANSYIKAHMNDLATNWKETTDSEKRKLIIEQAEKSFEPEDYSQFNELISK